MSHIILGIETSCDDTAVALVDEGNRVLASMLSSQAQLHDQYGGVVPELASRRHSENMVHVLRGALDEAGVQLEDVDVIAVTRGPGLVGCLLVGVMVAKGLAWGTGIPIVGVNHLEAHVWAAVLDRARRLPVPSLALIVSGGHTELLLVEEPGAVRGRLIGHTRDDAAGEAFDKVARLLGLGYPGGPPIDRLAGEFNGELIPFPRPMLTDDSLDFSFSGLKTAVAVHLEEAGGGGGRPPAGQNGEETARIAASFQEAVVDVLVQKTARAVRRTGMDTLIVAGGVAANRQLRSRLGKLAEDMGIEVLIPPPQYCTDNAAMVAAAGRQRFLRRGADGLDLDVDPALSLRGE